MNQILSPTQLAALRVLEEKGVLSDADGFTLNTARSLERRGFITLRVWSAYKTPLSRVCVGRGWSARKSCTT